MNEFFPALAGIAPWHKAMLGKNPFPCGTTAAAAFFRPAARLCRKPVPAEKNIPASVPAALRRKIGMALRCWQVSQEITEDFILRGKLLPGMDMPMTLNFAMALGNYSRFFLFSGAGRLPAGAAAALHAAYVREMTALPAAMAVLRGLKGKKKQARAALFAARYSPAASAARLAAACSGELK